jgi:hypothetical protein
MERYTVDIKAHGKKFKCEVEAEDEYEAYNLAGVKLLNELEGDPLEAFYDTATSNHYIEKLK